MTTDLFLLGLLNFNRQYIALTYSFSYLEPACCSMSSSTVTSWPAYRFLKRQVRWSGIPISFRTFHSLLWFSCFSTWILYNETQRQKTVGAAFSFKLLSADLCDGTEAALIPAFTRPCCCRPVSLSHALSLQKRQKIPYLSV